MTQSKRDLAMAFAESAPCRPLITFHFREGDMVTLGDRRGKVIGFTLAGGVYVQFQDAKAPALCQRWELVVHERGPLKDTTEENPAATEATFGDLETYRRSYCLRGAAPYCPPSDGLKCAVCVACEEIKRLRRVMLSMANDPVYGIPPDVREQLREAAR